MLTVSNAFREKVLNSPSYLEWQYKVKAGGNEYNSEVIKDLSITGQLQSQFTLGSSLSKSLELELLVNERTELPPLITVEVILFNRVYEEEDGVLVEKIISEPPLLVGSFYVTEIDRTTYGKLKIKAIDMMGHTDYFSSSVDAEIFHVNITTVYEVIDAISYDFNVKYNPYYDTDLPKEDRIDLFPISMEDRYKEWPLTNFNNVALNFSYRQLLEYMAGLCGCNVKLNNRIVEVDGEDVIANEIEFFRFKDTNVTLDGDNYYNMTKGQYKFFAKGIVCTTQESNSVVIGDGKDSETIKMTNPYMTDTSLALIAKDYCEEDGENFVEYYPITADIIGTCLFEPGDIVTIEEIYRERDGSITSSETFKIYIQDYKLSCSNGIKETLQSFFDYNKGSIANSISGKITQLNTDLENTKTYITENYINQTDFKITIDDLSTNIQYANDGLNKWIVEYYELTSPSDDYDLDTILGLDYTRRELIEDSERLVSGTIYEGTTVCRFRTGIYVKPEDDKLSKDVEAVTSIGANVYINGEKKISRASSSTGSDISDPTTITLRSGWNIIEIYVGYTRNIGGGPGTGSTAIETFFWLKYYDTEVKVPFYHLTSTFTEAEKEAERNYRTVAVTYVDYEGNTIKSVYEEKHKIGENYDVTGRVNTNYITYMGEKYFYVETSGKLKGTVEDTTIIIAKYINENYFYDNTYYINMEDNSKIQPSNMAYIRKTGSSYEPQLSTDIYHWKYEKSIIEYKTYNKDKNKIETTVEEFIGGYMSIGTEPIIGFTKKFYYKMIPETITCKVDFVDYETNEVVSTKNVSARYGTHEITVSTPSGYKGIGSNATPGTYFVKPETHINLSPVGTGNTFKVYVISTDKVYVTAKVINSYTGESELTKAVTDKGNKLVYSIYGFTILGPDGDVTSVNQHDYEIFKPLENYITEVRTIEYDDVFEEFSSGYQHIISPLVYDTHINLIYRYSSQDVSEASLIDDFDMLPALDESSSSETKEKIYSRFPYITLINPYVIDINYKRVTEVERLTNPDSIIDRITETKYVDSEGNEYTSGADYLFKQSEVYQDVNTIKSTVKEHSETLEETSERMSEVTQTVDGFKLSFETALYGNYLSNSAFSTDDPLTGFNYHVPTRGSRHDIFTYTKRLDTGENIIESTARKEETGSYGFLRDRFYSLTGIKGNKFNGIASTDSEDAYTSSNRTLSMGSIFKISQIFYKEGENFPFYKDNNSDEYLQFYISIKAKRTENCILGSGRFHRFPYMYISINFNYDYEVVMDETTFVETSNHTINNLVGQPAKDEGKPEYGFEVDLDNLAKLENYEIDTEWKQIEYFVNIPKDIFDNMKCLNSITVSYEPKYLPSISKSCIITLEDGTKDYEDVEEISNVIRDNDSIFICEPMFGTTKNYSSLPFTTKNAELVTGITNITQDGIQISRSDSRLSTEIRNNGMSVLYDNEPVAVFKEKTLIPELEVTKKISAPNMFINDYYRAIEYTEVDRGDYSEYYNVKYGTEIPEEIIIDPYYAGDDLGYWGGNFAPTKIAPVFNYFNEMTEAFKQYGVIQLDKLTIRIKKEDGGVYPFALGGGGGTSFLLENLRCGIIEIILEEDVELICPLVIKNIEGVVKIRGPIEEHQITLDDTYINGIDGVGRAPIIPTLIVHNVRWLEVYGINFSGGNDYVPYDDPVDDDSFLVWDPKQNGYVDSSGEHPGVFQTNGEFLTSEFNTYSFPFCQMYTKGTLKELNDILNKVAIFIGYCTLVDISYCNFPVVKKQHAYFNGITKYDIGILGDHCDCYLTNNKGTFTTSYYKNRDKCWFRIPEDNNIDGGIPSTQPIYSESNKTINIDLTDDIFPGGMIAKNKTTGKPLDHCYVGKSRELAYIGSLQFSGGSDLSTNTVYELGTNTTGYSRIKNAATLKPLETIYSTTDGYFFGASSSLPSTSYSPNNTTDASYTDYSDLKYTTLYNGQGVSIEMPDMKSVLVNKRLDGASLELEFETAYSSRYSKQTLVEYGSTSALGEYNGSELIRGGVSDISYNAGVSFGVRFVYDDDAHYDGSSLRKGYYNMGKATRAHEILSSDYSINTWAIDDNGDSIHSIQNFSPSKGEVAYPFYVGTPCSQGVSSYVYKVNIDLGAVNENWFTQEYKDSFRNGNFSDTSSGTISYDEFFNTLTGIANGAIKYIDVAPVGVRDGILEDAFPIPSRYSHFDYDATGENDSTIALSTSCFKIKRAKLVLNCTNIAPIAPETFTLTIHHKDNLGKTIFSDTVISKYDGTIINLDNYKYSSNGYSFVECKEVSSSQLCLESNMEITFIYTTNYTVTVKYLDTSGSSIRSNYVITVESGKSYDVSAQTNVTISGYNYSGIEGDPVSSSSINGNKTIIVRYAKIVYYTVTVKYLDTNGTSIRSNYTLTVEKGKSYDVSAQTNVTIDGYIKSSVSGGSTSSSSISGNVTITVTYRLVPVDVGIEPSTFNMLGSKYGSDEDEAPISSDLYLGELWDESPNNSGANDLYARVRWNGGSSSPLYLGGGSRQNYISCNDFYTWGTLFSGIQLNFDWDTIANRSNTASSIKLKLTFDSRQFGIEGAVADKYNAFINDNIHFNVRLLLGSLKANERLGVQKTLDYSDYSVEIGNIGGIPKEVYTHYGYVTGYWRRPGDVLDPNKEVYGNTFVLTQSQTTFELDLLGIKIAEDISFRNQVMGANYPEMPADIFTDIRKLFNGKYVKAIQIIPVTDVPTDDPILTIHSVGCRKLIDSKLIIE